VDREEGKEWARAEADALAEGVEVWAREEHACARVAAQKHLISPVSPA
jgi:hypothetical protein